MHKILLFLPTILMAGGYFYQQIPPTHTAPHQTRGAVIYAEADRVAELHAQMGHSMQATCDALGVQLEWVEDWDSKYEKGAYGHMDSQENTIRIRRGLTDPILNTVFFHEVGHFLFHGNQNARGRADWMEPEADHFAQAVNDQLGYHAYFWDSSSQY